MRFASAASLSAIFVVVLFTISSPASADTIYLRNGSQIEGKVVDNRETTGELILFIGENGRMVFRSGQIDRVVIGAPPEAKAVEPKAGEPVVNDFVVVEVPEGRDRFGKGTYLPDGKGCYYGNLSAETDESTVVLDIPNVGKIRIERVPGLTIKKSDVKISGVNAPAPTREQVIQTTHVIHLKNGQKIAGNIVPTGEFEPLKIEFGSMGRMQIPRSQIAGTEEAQGTIKLPEETPPPKAETEKPAVTPEAREELKRELRVEILKEILDQLIEERLGSAAAMGEESFKEEMKGLSNDDILAIQDSVRELCRQRTVNRVRAERHLKDAGAVVLPFLAPVASHPFELTRRAVQRIVRDLGDMRGAPIAIKALNDQDEFVRALAREALQVILPSSIAYDANAPEKDRLAAQAKYERLWAMFVGGEVREAILAKLAAE